MNYKIKDFINHFELVSFLNDNNIKPEDIISISATTSGIRHSDNSVILIWIEKLM